MSNRKDDLQQKNSAEVEPIELKRKKRPRKIIGEEGSRKQTAIGLIASLVLSLLFYLPKEIKNWWQGFNSTETITVLKPIGDSPDLSEVLGFEVEIKEVSGGFKFFKTTVEKLVGGLTGDYGIYVKSLSGKDEWGQNEDEVFTAASVIKLPILVAYYQEVDEGKIDPDDTYTLVENDRLVYGTGSMQSQPIGTKYSYNEVARLVANQSDNMGAEVLVKKLGGYNKTQKIIDEWGLESVSLKKNEISPKDVSWLLERVYSEELLTKRSRDELFENLTNTVNEDRLSAGVPTGVRVIHKFGSEAGVVNDCGIVEANKPYLICVLSTNINAGDAEALLPKISRVAWEWLK